MIYFNITNENARKYNMNQKEGVMVNTVQNDSKAKASGIWMGDMITGINKRSVTTTKV